jgi:ATP-dependent Lhr-like helicase
LSIQAADGNVPTLILAGRYWRVVTSDWKSRVVYVEPSENKGKASWLGSSKALRFDLCQTMKQVLVDGKVPATLSNRAKARLDNLSSSFEALDAEKSTAVKSVKDGRSEWRWWTFAGGGANFLLAEVMFLAGNKPVAYDNLSLKLKVEPILSNQAELPDRFSPQGEKRIKDLAKALKFNLCLPEARQIDVIRGRLIDRRGAAVLIQQNIVGYQGESH